MSAAGRLDAGDLAEALAVLRADRPLRTQFDQLGYRERLAFLLVAAETARTLRGHDLEMTDDV